MLLKSHFQVKVFELGIFAANICNHTLGVQFDGLNRVAFPVVEKNLNVVKTDSWTLLDFLIAVEVGLQIIFGSSHLDLGGIFQH